MASVRPIIPAPATPPATRVLLELSIEEAEELLCSLGADCSSHNISVYMALNRLASDREDGDSGILGRKFEFEDYKLKLKH